MADIHIERQHGMTLAEARSAAVRWSEEAQKKFDMECSYEAGDTSDELSFKRSGVSGTLKVDKDNFALDAKLGFLLSAFKEKIEAEIGKNLDALVSSQTAQKA